MSKADDDVKYMQDKLEMYRQQLAEVMQQMQEHGSSAVLPRLSRKLKLRRCEEDATLYDLKHQLDLEIDNLEWCLKRSAINDEARKKGSDRAE